MDAFLISKNQCMKKLLVILTLLPALVNSQIPEITGAKTDTSSYAYTRIQIRMESLFIEMDSTASERYFKRARLYTKIEEYQLAIKDFNKSAALLPSESSIYYYRGAAYDRLGEYKKAILDFNKVIEMNPKFEWGYVDRGMMFFQTKDYDKAEADFKKVLELKPDWSYALTNLGKVYAEKTEFDNAITHFKLALKNDPTNYLAHQNLGYTYFLQEEYDLAIESYTNAIAAFPNYYNAIRSRADAKNAKGDFKGFCMDMRLAAGLGDEKAIAFLKTNGDCGN